MKRPCVYVALIHYPVINKEGRLIASSVTNLDLHDISRICRTYGVKRYFVVQPLREQRELIEELLTYWQKGSGALYNADRQEALKILQVTPNFETCLQKIEAEAGEALVIGTDARKEFANLSYAEGRRLCHTGRPVLLLLGTAWGLAPKLLDRCQYVLEPIYGSAEDGYNHLSVRAAAAIILDRLLGEPWWKSLKEGDHASRNQRD
ncbi:MAG: RNA methyltransferase [Thermodesulfobacteria bacterium]|nr:RNA methyltransferase [Thermodesulfobacteriota bacterium]